MLSTVIKRQKNVVDYLALTTSGFLKILLTYYYQRQDGKIKENEELSCWQEPPEDVKEMIVKRMSLSGRARLSSLCNSWRLVCMRREIPTCPQLPWLVHPQPKTRDSLTFSSLSVGKVFKSRLPCPDFKSSRLNKLVGRITNQRSAYFLYSSRGWLVMLDWEHYNRITRRRKRAIYLVNPVSGAQQRLPPVPGYKENFDNSLINPNVVLSSPDVSTCLVAATLGTQKLLYADLETKAGACFRDRSECGAETWIENRSLKFGDEEVKLKVIYEKEEWWIDEGLLIQELEGEMCTAYLSETTNNQLLLIYQIPGNGGEDVMEGHVVDEEGNINNNNFGEGDENDMEGNEQNENVLGWVGQFLCKALHLLKSSFSDDNVYISEDKMFYSIQA
ncbi:hypothetical protein ACLB2K_011158 [Fragaria x ananassa]